MDELRPSRCTGLRCLAPVAAMAAAATTAACTPMAPAVPLFGAFFPSWLLSAFAGVAVAIVVRVIFVRIGLDDALPARLPVYIAIATIAGLLVSSFAFGR